METEIYRPKYAVRFVTAASLFDGHDASINIMRRILQASGVEVIHLGHNRSVSEVVDAAIQEDVQGIAVSSYQGGHMEYFKYMYDLLQERNAGHIRIFGGGGGVIVYDEIRELEGYGIAKIFSPDDGRRMGLQGMINEMIRQCDYPTTRQLLEAGTNPEDVRRWVERVKARDPQMVGRLITLVEQKASDEKLTRRLGLRRADRYAGEQTVLDRTRQREPKEIPDHALNDLQEKLRGIISAKQKKPILGVTGTGGAGKSSLTDELVLRFLRDFPDKTVAILSVDPSKQKTGGALLGDRIRMNAIDTPRVFMRSLATRDAHSELSDAIQEALDVVEAADFDLIIVETSGIGQGDAAIVSVSDVSLYVMTGEFGAPSQLEKIDMLDFADLVAINKFDRQGSEDALRDVRKQYRRNHQLFDAADDDLPIYGTVASQFNDPGITRLYHALINLFRKKTGVDWVSQLPLPEGQPGKQRIIPPERSQYLREIVNTVRTYQSWVSNQAAIARKLYQLKGAKETLSETIDQLDLLRAVDRQIAYFEERLDPQVKQMLERWSETKETYRQDRYTYRVRDKKITVDLYTTSLAGTRIPRIVLPRYEDWGDLTRWLLSENLPGYFPYTAGVFPFKREGEDPKRQFAGEGTPERTNKRFHYLSKNDPAKRLSTAFDSVTLYGHDPDYRPDIYGKVGESGVSICTLDDMKKLYAGFDLCSPGTSVSMTINGPAPIILAMYMNTAIDQQVEAFRQKEGREPASEEFERIKAYTLSTVRGTVQADILKEDQGQNTCIFSTEFALRMMGDIQQYFIDHQVRNYYSVSISGYHIAEAGANPISQLAFTLANGFTFIEYYLSRGMHIDDFAPNLSFFFSNGLDPEYSVIGRVARRIWSVVLKNKYGANERSQKLKYHIQTSGRSLHAQEMQFNDIRTTLQALLAIYDNCNSLHTNAYDEAITTPTEESVRRAMAIQLIITKEFGLAKNENPLQGSFIIEELTDLVEEAVLAEFERLNDRGGVLGAMERQYQRGKIQEESLYYEAKKHSGELPIIGVNTFENPRTKEEGYVPPKTELARATQEEKETQIRNLNDFKAKHQAQAQQALKQLQETAVSGGNIFAELMETVKTCSLGQITQALYEVGGKYRRNI